ncbi:hypothetical protein OsJ_05167 [Oryza sativa Japonica Group]|uniref:Uncharacterized protein n=1 Tax=Oryza sativa subsp. japonica TaxID=39947 RepID=A3A2K1_ORYSJ|nr:hypothetical protein OsJ_05167 [Oryza sativa Japonica Group]
MASSGGVVVEAFTEEEHEVAAILRDLADLVRARHRRRRRRRVQREEIPSWGCRRPRTTPGEKKPAPPADVGRRHEAAASPDTPLAFLVPDESSGDDVAARAAPPRKAPASHAEWVEEQRAVVASLSQENSHLSKQIEEYRVRLQSSRSTNDGLKQMQRKIDDKVNASLVLLFSCASIQFFGRGVCVDTHLTPRHGWQPVQMERKMRPFRIIPN